MDSAGSSSEAKHDSPDAVARAVSEEQEKLDDNRAPVVITSPPQHAVSDTTHQNEPLPPTSVPASTSNGLLPPSAQPTANAITQRLLKREASQRADAASPRATKALKV